MSKGAIKMVGLAMMMASIFVLVFGMHAAEMGAAALLGPILVAGGLLLFLTGSAIFAFARFDSA